MGEKIRTGNEAMLVPSEAQSMRHLLDVLDVLHVDIARLDHGELTSIHETVKDLIGLAQHGDPEADWRLFDGLSEASNNGFSAYSVIAAFRG
jgi:hypothetical protein